MERKKHKSKNITKSSARQILSWKDMQKAKKQGAVNRKQVTRGKKQKAINRRQRTIISKQGINKLQFKKIILKLNIVSRLKNTFKLILNIFRNPKHTYQTIKLKIKSWPKRKRIITFSFSSTLAAITIVMVIFQFILPTSNTQGATYIFNQTSWAGGVTANTATHPTNETNWTEYSAKDATVAAGAGGVSLTTSNYSAVDSGVVTAPALGFGAGTLSSTAISGSGASAKVGLGTTTIPASTNRSESFAYSGAVASWTAPADVTSITIDAKGAGGGAGYANGTIYYNGAAGGSTIGTLAVTPGTTYYFLVGGAGANGAHNTVSAGGYGGGGTASNGNGDYIGGGGGGMTWFSTHNTFAGEPPLLVAGGGGGAGGNGNWGGNGGGTTGNNGTGGATVAYGGTQTAGGAAGTGGSGNGTAGSAGQGGNGAGVSGGGGGGYYGGGGGGWESFWGGGGGGGSSYLNSSLTTTSTTQGGGAAATTNGSLIITYNSAASSFYYSGSVVPYVVPAGAGFLTINLSGAGGGTNPGRVGPGGPGGSARGTLAVTPGTTYYVNVGGKGGNTSSSTTGIAGYGGGAAGGGSYGAGGGGMTWFSAQNSFQQNSNLKLVAGGGGGTGASDLNFPGVGGGAGGGVNGVNGVSGTGGTQSAGGTSGGTAGVGGVGVGSGGGGGGGYYGGGGGVNAGGGGGSGYISSSLANASTTQGGGPAEATNGNASIIAYGYNSSGTFTSGIINTGAPSVFSTLAYSATLNSQTLSIKARTCSASDCAGATAWASCSNITSGQALSTGGCATNGHRYVQYQASLSTNNPAVTPTLSSVTINYSQFNSSGTLTSSIYDSGSAGNVFGDMRWSATGTSANETVKFQIRTASTSGGIAASSWCGPADTSSPCSGTSYFTTSAGSTLPSGSPLTTGGDDQFFQYKVFLTSGGAFTPTLTSTSVYYVVNAPPDFDTTSGSGVTVSQISTSTDPNWGKIKIDYSIRDVDTTSGSFTQNYVTPTFEYTLNGTDYYDVDLDDITFGTAPVNGDYGTYMGKTTNKVLEGSYLTYSAYWNAKDQIPENNSDIFKIRVKLNDNEGANNISTAISNETVLDTINPTNVSFAINNNNNQLTLTAPSDDSSYKMYVSNFSDFHDASLIDFTSPYTHAGLTADPATVYLRIKDAYNNYTDFSASTPAQAQNLKYYDTSIPSDDMYQEFIVWDVISAEEVGAGFASYNVYRQKDSDSFELVKNVGDRTFNYYLSENLSPDHEYTYKLTATDINGNVSEYSESVSDTPNGIGSSNDTPPTITGVSFSEVTTTSAKITWTTNEIADSSVGFSEDYTYLPERGIASYTTNHEITLTGLTPDTNYNFKVKSRNAGGYQGSVCYGGDGCSPGSNDPDIFHFRTLNGPKISKVRVEESSNKQATITWETDADSDSHIYYSSSASNGELVNPQSVDNNDYVGGDYPYIHEMTLTGLSQSTAYYFYVESTGVSGPSTLKNLTSDPPFFSFITGNDDALPVISEPEAAIISNTQVAIHWTTNKPANSKVEYKKGDEHYSDNTPVTLDTYDKSHYIILSNLTSNTDYTFKVTSVDINGNSAEEDDNTFTTLRDPGFQHEPLSEITDIPEIPSIITDTKAVITFNTDQAAKCAIEYGTETGNYSEVPFVENDYNENHSIHITGLIFSTPYFYKITCEDNLENTVESDEYTFTTSEKLYTETEATGLTDKIAPSISNVSNGTITGESATITWDTDEKSNSLVRFGITSDYGNMAGNDLVNFDPANYVTSHTVIINNLTPATKYYFVVGSTDASGNIGESTEDSFTTKSPSSLSSIKVSSTSLSEVIITWSTSSNMTSTVEYGITTSYGESKSSNASTKDHSVQISGLKTATTYHFRVKGTDADNNIYSSGDYSFEPKSPPKVTGATVDSITEHGAKINVSTDIPTDVLVTYFEKGNETNSGSQGKPDFATKHEINITNLNAGTTYVYTVKVSDEQGNQTTNDPKEFTTEKDETPPTIDNIHTDSALAQSDKVQTIISAKTNEPATASVFYKEGKNGQEKELKMTTNLSTSHVAVLTSFKPGTVYNFRIVAKDASGNEATSQAFSLLTPIQKENIIQVIVNNFQDIFGWMKK